MTVVNLTLTTESDDLFPIQMDSEDGVAQLHAYVEALTGLKPADQVLVVDGKNVPDSGTLAAAGIKDKDLLFIMLKTRGSVARVDPTALHPDGTAVNPDAFMAALRADSRTMANLRNHGSQRLLDALLNSDAAALQHELRRIKQVREVADAEAALPADPLDPEYQRKMFEAIQKKNIEENYMNAMEHSPEVFASVEMLYVDMAVNGEPVKAFIDSGAQMTIMTQPCAEKCGIMRLVDTRFCGVAVGVGSSKIVGRIHTCAVKVGDQHIASSITVLEQKDGPQFIFGLDNLKRHHCCINLHRGVLEIGSCNIAMPFLAEHEVPSDFNRERQRAGDGAEGDSAEVSPETVQGDLSAVRRTSSVDPVADSVPMSTDTPAVAASRPSPSTNTPAAGTDSGAASEAAQRLHEITGKEVALCEAALKRANGNIDVAAAELMGF